ncbi:hypothetical protein ACWIUH_05575 [Ursidibacter arcticus]
MNKINEQDKQAILNGAYGITNAGYKAKIVYKSLEDTEYPYLVVVNTRYGETSYWVDKNLCGAFAERNITGLWVRPLKPFNLEKALAGEPVRLRGGEKAFVIANLRKIHPNIEFEFPLSGYVEGNTSSSGKLLNTTWNEDGKFHTDSCSNYDIIGMWEEPEPENNTVTVTLPKTLSEPRDEMWTIYPEGVTTSIYNINIPKEVFNKGIFFGSKEDAQAWYNAMRNVRR